MDSTAIPIEAANAESFELISRLILSMFIIPVIWALRKYTMIFVVLDPVEFKLILMVLAMWGINSWMNIGLDVGQVVDKALAMLGLAAVMFRGGKHIKGAINKYGRRTDP